MTSLSASNQRVSPLDSRHQRGPSRTPLGFYGHTRARRSPEEETWQPGQYLPSHTEPPPEPDFYTLLVQMKSSISTQLQQVQTSVDTLSGRVDKLERDWSNTAEKIHSSKTPQSSCSSPLASSESDGVSRRKKRISTDLANAVRTVHNNLPDDKQLKIHETIDSEHNKKVIGFVKKEIDALQAEYSTCEIKKSLAQYRRTLCRKPKETEAANEARKKHSRKQRTFERRGCLVVEAEREKWKDVTACMMSDEEDVGKNMFKTHQPEWRSAELNEFLKQLDGRADTKAANRAHPRRNRILGTPLKTTVPAGVSDWMVNHEEIEPPSSPTLF